MTPFEQIPFSFLMNHLTDYQKETIEIKYHIKKQVANRVGFKERIYEQLADDLHICISRVRKIEKS